MPILSAILPKLPKKLSNQFVRNLRWLGLAEIISRIFRLGLTLILARLGSLPEATRINAG
jgi:hypothetical protein